MRSLGRGLGGLVCREKTDEDRGCLEEASEKRDASQTRREGVGSRRRSANGLL